MTQRIFDIENEEDMKLLWSILPSRIKYIEKTKPFTYDGKLKLIKINWHDKTEITRPVNYEDMIGCVGWFWDSDDGEKSLGVLTGYYPETGFPFVNNANYDCLNFRPAKKSELKLYKDTSLNIGNYDEKKGIYCGNFKGKDVWCALHDAPGQMNWQGAKKYCSLKDSVLPDIDILTRVFLNKDEINKSLEAHGGEKFKEDDWYWSSSESTSNGCWLLTMTLGVRATSTKTYYAYVRSFQLL